jgi:hypothetical protein
MSNLPLTSRDVAAFRADAESMMTDLCALAPRVDAKDGAGEEIPGEPVWGNPIRCSFDVRPGSKAFGENHTLLNYDAGIRLPAGTAVDVRGWIKCMQRFGNDCDGPIYEIVGPAQNGPSATRFLLKRVET